MRNPMAMLSVVSLMALGGCGATASMPNADTRDLSVVDNAHGPFDLLEPDRAAGNGADLANPGQMADASMSDGGCNVVCDSPPAPVCKDNANIIIAVRPGTCAGNACSYSTVTASCNGNGCMNGCDPVKLCGPLNYLGSTAAFVNGSDIHIKDNTAVTVAAGASVSVTTQTAQHGAARTVHLFYAMDSQYKTQKEIVLGFDKLYFCNDQFFAVIPGQPSGTHVWFYLRADGPTGMLYDPQGGPGNNYELMVQ